MVSQFRSSIDYMNQMGIIDVVLPFLIVFVVVYAILEKTLVFGMEKGKPKKNLNAMAAFIVAFIFISFSSQVSSLVVYLQIMVVFLVFLMGIAYLFALFNMDLNFLGKKTYFTFIIMIILIISLVYSIGLINGLDLNYLFSLFLNPVVIIVLSFILVIWFITSDINIMSGGNGTSKQDLGDVGSELEKHNFKLVHENDES